MTRGQPRVPRTEQRWRGLLDRWRHSGLSVRAFCRQHDLAEPSFYAWRRRLTAAPQGSAADAALPVTFVPVHVRPEPAPPSALELVLADGRVLRVPAGFDLATVRGLLALLAEVPC